MPELPFAKIDVHTHILPESWPDLEKRYGYGGFVQLEHRGPGCARMLRDGKPFRDVADNCFRPEARIADLVMKHFDLTPGRDFIELTNREFMTGGLSGEDRATLRGCARRTRSNSIPP